MLCIASTIPSHRSQLSSSYADKVLEIHILTSYQYNSHINMSTIFGLINLFGVKGTNVPMTHPIGSSIENLQTSAYGNKKK
jgi:hypothetical protein